MSCRRYISKNVKNKTYICIIMPFVLYGCETWFLTLMEGHRLCVFENRVLRDIFGPRKRKQQENAENYVIKTFIFCSQNIG